MMFPGSIDRASKAFGRVLGRSPTAEKTAGERRYRRHNALAIQRINVDPERFETETFNAPRLTSWDLW